MTFEPFEMERWQSLHEHHVEINLSDSGVHPLTLEELATEDERAALAGRLLTYTQTNGTPELRALIAALYPGADASHVQVTNGGAEANFLVTWSLLRPGDEVVCMLPNYMQVPGIARSFGATVRGWELVPDLDGGRWRLDLDALADLVNERTRMIVVCNPNNPTGRRLTGAELDGICAVAGRVGAWVLSDEIYQGSELDGERTPTVYGRYERALVTNSLSKAYGLPGLRLGWVVAPPEVAADLWARHDYTTIAPAALSDDCARIALRPDVRARLLGRTRDLLGRNFALMRGWLDEHADHLRYVPPDAGAMLYLRYAARIGSSALAERLRSEKSVLLVPGDHYGMDGWLRIGFGGETGHVEEGLARVAQVLRDLE